jgi:hypothetical protein
MKDRRRERERERERKNSPSMISPRVKIIITEGDEEARDNKHTFVNVFV